MEIFKKVHCKAYLKKESDGIYLNCMKRTPYEFGGQKHYSTEPAKGNAWDEDDDIEVTAVWSRYENGSWVSSDIKDLSAFEGEFVDKRYRVRVEEEFDGFLVGITSIVTHGTIGTDFDMYPYNMNGGLRGVKHLTRNTVQEKVAVVYFKNNAKRYVYLDDMEYVE